MQRPTVERLNWSDRFCALAQRQSVAVVYLVVRVEHAVGSDIVVLAPEARRCQIDQCQMVKSEGGVDQLNNQSNRRSSGSVHGNSFSSLLPPFELP